MTAPLTQLLGTVSHTANGDAAVTFDRAYATDAADLWDAVTSADRLARWFAPVEGDLAEGGSFTIHFDDGDISRCRVVACASPRSFGWEWPHDGQPSRVDVEVAPDGAGARLRLTHTRLSAAPAPGYAAGWDAFVHRLEDHLAGREPGEWWDDFADLVQRYAAQLT